MLRSVVALLTMSALSAPALAGEPINGTREATCAVLLDYLDNARTSDPAVARYRQMWHWVMGFVSAYHVQHGGAQTTGADEDRAFQRDSALVIDGLQSSCRAAPTQHLYTAAAAFLRAQGRRMQ